MAAEPLPVPVDSNSLYVCTIPLATGFHFGLLHVDRDGTATGHHWAAITIDPHGPEGYVGHGMPLGPRTKVGHQPILAYFKVPEYHPMDISAFRDVCASVFPKGSNASQNRAANVNSRTWVTRVLARLLGSPERAVEIEQYVSAHSRVFSDGHACAFLFGRPYTTRVIPIAPCNSPCMQNVFVDALKSMEK